MNEAIVPAIPADRQPSRDKVLPFSTHLVELRRSLVVSAIAVAVLSVAASYFVDPLLKDLARPVGRLYFLSPAEAFLTKLKLSIFAGAFLSAPVVFFELWCFIQRGLFPRERKAVLLLAGTSLALFAAGAVFCYTLVLPVSVSFLMRYGSEMLVPFISVTHYVSFVSRMMLSFGIAFELPLAMWFLVKSGLVHSATLSRNRRLAIVLVFLAAAVLTPTTDVFNQLLLAGPLLLLYEAGIVAARVSERRGFHGQNRGA